MVSTWIFVSDKKIPETETFLTDLKQRLSSWDSHGELVPNSFELIENQIIIVDAQPGATSGCSRDALHKIVNTLLALYDCTMLPSSEVIYRANDQSIQNVDFRKVPEMLQNNTMTSDTIIFDAHTRISGDTSWEKPLKNTWLAKFLQPA
ncbi:MAG: hypothetical protein LC115_00820 [Bacteroidia bacterium]|nr:hypothetical protein [Bacteroidia bacterium]